MGENNGRHAMGPRCIAIVGPYLSGKTTLLESILYRTGAIQRQGKVADGSSLGDASPEARAHGMSVELNAATTTFLDETYTFLDCPGSVEFSHDARLALAGCDAAVVVCEPDDKKVPALQVILKELDELSVPRFLFVNKIDKSEQRLRDMLAYLQPASATPLVLRQVPLWESGIVAGFVDLALERAFVYREHAASEVVDMPADMQDREKEARFEMLEKLADYDDELLEQLLSDIEPPRDKVFDDLTRELKEGLITPVLFGSAENGNGILRLLKALRHEAPDVAATAGRLGVEAGGGAVGQVLKTFHTAHGGKLSLTRVLAGEIGEGSVLYGAEGQELRAAGVFTLMGTEQRKSGKAGAGETVALGRLEDIRTGETVSTEKGSTPQVVSVAPPQGVYGLAISVADRKDEVKLTTAAQRLMEEDPSLVLTHEADTHEMVLWGQGEMHLRVALERLATKFGVHATAGPRHIAYKETIRKQTQVKGRHKKQSGGHGQFGDVVIEIRPLSRGEGFQFTDTISGGVVPKQYIPAVESGGARVPRQGPPGLSGDRCRGQPVGRQLPCGRFLRNGLQDGGAHRHERGHAAMLARPARADRGGRYPCAVRCHGAHQPDRLGPARPASRLRCQRGLAGLGHGQGAHAGGRDRQPHHRAALGDRRGRHLQLRPRPSGRTERQARRPGDAIKEGRGGEAKAPERDGMKALAP